jgi:Fe-S-cluster-containing hydrogenase component 2
VSACPPRLFSLEAEGWHKVSVLRDDYECTGCVRCAVECPVHAITMRKRPAQPAVNAGAGRGGWHPIVRIVESSHAERTASPE